MALKCIDKCFMKNWGDKKSFHKYFYEKVSLGVKCVLLSFKRKYFIILNKKLIFGLTEYWRKMLIDICFLKIVKCFTLKFAMNLINALQQILSLIKFVI